VNQGDSLLFSSGNFNVLIDTGNVDSDYGVIPYLKSHGVNKLDYLIITHGDDDHIKEAINIIENIKTNKIILNTYNNAKEEQLIKYLINNNIKYENIGYKLIEYKSISIELQAFDYVNENENSVITHITFNNHKILLMADAYQEQEKLLNYNNVDILKIGHHGSNTSTSNYLIDITDPKISLISVGANNRYKHPSDETIQKLNQYYQTSINGSVIIEFKSNIYVKKRF
jgi:competence protein ComEC